MKKYVAKLSAERNRLMNENRVLRWLYLNDHDSELAMILRSADEHESLDDLLRFMAWALERQLLGPCHSCLICHDDEPF